MLQNIFREAREVPNRVRETSEKLAERRREARRWLRSQLHTAREQGERNLFDFGVEAFETAEVLVDRTEGVPVLEQLGAGARNLLEVVEKSAIRPPLEGYDDLNVRQVMAALRELDHFGLMRIARYESAHKNRKTILDAIEREENRRARLATAA